MKITVPAIRVGELQSSVSRAPRAGPTLKLLSLGSKTATRGRAGQEQDLLQTVLLTAGVFAPDHLVDATHAFAHDAGAFYAKTSVDTDSVRPALRHVNGLLSKASLERPKDYFSQYAAAQTGLSASVVAAAIEYFEAMESSDRDRLVSAVIEYAVPIVAVDKVASIALVAANRSRINLLSRPTEPSQTLSEQVRTNTDQIKALVARMDSTSKVRKKRT